MSYTIFSKASAFPVAIAGSKLVKTFPSGLVLVSQEYAVPRGQEDAYASTFAVGQPLAVDSPAIDGLYIFPEPGWRDSGDGFTRLTVSAYGRWNTIGQKTFSKTLGGFVAAYSKNDTRFSSPEHFSQFSKSVATINDLLFWQFVLPKNASPNVTVSDLLAVYRLNGANADPVSLNEFFDRTGYNTRSPDIVASPTISLGVSKNLTRAENTNFGAWDEWTVVWSASPPSDLNLGTFYKILPPLAGSINLDLAIGPVAGLPSDSFSINLKQNTNTTYNDGNAFFVNLDKVESVHTIENSFGSSSIRTNLPASTNSTSFRGGNVLWQPNGLFSYTAPPVTRPTGLASAFQVYTSNGFTWTTKNIGGNNFDWTFQTSYEIFTFTFKNEINQTGEGYLTIRFDDPVNPAPL